jgi:hypothetical protein
MRPLTTAHRPNQASLAIEKPRFDRLGVCQRSRRTGNKATPRRGGTPVATIHRMLIRLALDWRRRNEERARSRFCKTTRGTDREFIDRQKRVGRRERKCHDRNLNEKFQ